jgi:hypothetical protein
MPEHKKPLTSDQELFARETDCFRLEPAIRRKTWPRAKVYLSTDACLFSQAAMKAPPQRFYRAGQGWLSHPGAFPSPVARHNLDVQWLRGRKFHFNAARQALPGSSSAPRESAAFIVRS